MADRCDLTELLVSDCAHCRKLPDPLAVEAPESRAGDGVMGVWFAARYAGRCSACGTDFEAGDVIRADGEDGWQGECCGGDDR